MEKINQCTYYSHTTIAWWLSTLGVLKPRVQKLQSGRPRTGLTRIYGDKIGLSWFNPFFQKIRLSRLNSFFSKKNCVEPDQPDFSSGVPDKVTRTFADPCVPIFGVKIGLSVLQAEAYNQAQHFFPPFFSLYFTTGSTRNFRGKGGFWRKIRIGSGWLWVKRLENWRVQFNETDLVW